jgi:hypothetical protein
LLGGQWLEPPVGGMPVEAAWASLELLADKVLTALG